MNNLVLPICGKSTRYPERPKWLYTHPSGNTMLTESIKGMDLNSFDKIYIIALSEHEKKYGFKEKLIEEINANYSIKTSYAFLNKQTKNQAETVHQGLKQVKCRGSILIKDSDNYFTFNNTNYESNFVAVCNLYDYPDVTAVNKSYVMLNNKGLVSNIVEKKIISQNFCCGGYFFKNVDDFYKTFEYLKKQSFNNEKLYISHIISQMLLDNHIFFTQDATDYVDWGTHNDWVNYKKMFTTYFVDIDGILVKNSARGFKPYWGTTEGIIKNIDFLNNEYDSKKGYIVLTTSRDVNKRNITIEQLKKYGVKYHQLIMGLPSCKRMLINDFTSGSFPSAIAINLKRNIDSLSEEIKKC
jgi:hypothetical protein